MGSIRMPLLGQDVNEAIMFTEPLYGKHKDAIARPCCVRGYHVYRATIWEA